MTGPGPAARPSGLSNVEFHEELRHMWRRRLTDADKRLTAATADKALAERELDAIDNTIAELRLAEAADLLKTGAPA